MPYEYLNKSLFLYIALFGILSIQATPNSYDSHANTTFHLSTINSGDTLATKKRIYHTQRTEKPPIIDGKLDDDCWKQGEWQSDYTQFTPTYNTKASHKTEIKILYNDESIFVAIRAYDDMDKMTRRLGRRDHYSGDLVGVMFDSYFDHRTAYEFDVTSAGQKLDVWLTNDGWDVNWNAVWYAKIAYEDTAWTAEFSIPLSQLRYGASENQVWGFNSWRKIDRLQEESHWNLIANDGTGLVYTFGELHDLNNLKKNRRIEIAPYVSGKITTDKKIPNNPFAKGSRFEGFGGLDAKIGLSNNFTLDATINPDFGQVEADPSVLNLSAFEIFFEEKRPFFIEGKNIFEFNFDQDYLFYTRRIGQQPSYRPQYDTIRMPEFTTIGGALKISGKTENGLSLGIIESVALKESAQIHNNNDDFEQSVEPLTNFFIGRFQKEFDGGNTIVGGILTNTYRNIRDEHLNFLSKNALTYGIDFTKFWADRKYFLDAKVVGSNIKGDENAILTLQTSSARYYQRPDIKNISLDSTRTDLNGIGALMRLGKGSKGHWRYDEEIIIRSPGLEFNDLGYMQLSNILKNNTNVSYIERENKGIFKTYSFNLLQQNAWDMQGEDLYSSFSIAAESDFMNNWSASIGSDHKFNITDEQLLRGGLSMKVPNSTEYSWKISSDSSKKIYWNLIGSYGYRNVGNSENLNIDTEIGYRPVSNLVLSLQSIYEKNLDELQYIGQFEDQSSNNKWLLGEINNQNLGFTFRADWAITPELTIQYYGSPFVSIGKYSEFKEVTNPLDKEYYSRFKILVPDKTDSLYEFDNNGDGMVDYSIENPDFNYQQFRSNLVLRWEYKIGSTLYFVWSQDRTSFEQPGLFTFKNGYSKLFDLFPRNVFMIKLSYWLSN